MRLSFANDLRETLILHGLERIIFPELHIFLALSAAQPARSCECPVLAPFARERSHNIGAPYESAVIIIMAACMDG